MSGAGVMCVDDCHTYLTHFERKGVVSRNRLDISGITGIRGSGLSYVSSSQISVLSFYRFVDQGRVLNSQLRKDFTLSNPNKKRINPCLPLHFKDNSKPGKDGGGRGRGRA